MTPEAQKAWDECVERVRVYSVPADCDGVAIRFADAELTRLRSLAARAGDVEGISLTIRESGNVLLSIATANTIAAAVSAWIRGEE